MDFPHLISYTMSQKDLQLNTTAGNNSNASNDSKWKEVLDRHQSYQQSVEQALEKWKAANESGDNTDSKREAQFDFDMERYYMEYPFRRSRASDFKTSIEKRINKNSNISPSGSPPAQSDKKTQTHLQIIKVGNKKEEPNITQSLQIVDKQEEKIKETQKQAEIPSVPVEQVVKIKGIEKEKVQQAKQAEVKVSEAPVEHSKGEETVKQQKKIEQSANIVPSQMSSASTQNKKKPEGDQQSSVQKKKGVYLGRRKRKCKFYPECNKGKACTFTHPAPCKNFPNCFYGQDCAYVHKICPNQVACFEHPCPYVHRKEVKEAILSQIQPLMFQNFFKVRPPIFPPPPPPQQPKK